MEPETETETNSSGLPERNAELLREFAVWLETASALTSASPSEDEPSIGLYQLFEALASQRQEFKLFTKAGRQTQELLQQSIDATSEAVVSLKRFRKERPEIERKSVAPFLSSLIEIDESIQRADGVLESLRDRLAETIRRRIEATATAYCDELSWWSRIRQRKTVRRFVERLENDVVADVDRTVEPFRQGFEMLRRRMDDVLKKHSIRRLNPVGEPVDPETMQVVAVVDSTSISPGCVVDVVRFGYLWRNKPLRFADVRAAREK